MRRNPQTVPVFMLSGGKLVGFLHMGYHLFPFCFQKKNVMIKIMKREYG